MAKKAFFRHSWIPAQPSEPSTTTGDAVHPPASWLIATCRWKAGLGEAAIPSVQGSCLHICPLSHHACPFMASKKRKVNEQSPMSLCCLDTQLHGGAAMKLKINSNGSFACFKYWGNSTKIRGCRLSKKKQTPLSLGKYRAAAYTNGNKDVNKAVGFFFL